MSDSIHFTPSAGQFWSLEFWFRLTVSTAAMVLGLLYKVALTTVISMFFNTSFKSELRPRRLISRFCLSDRVKEVRPGIFVGATGILCSFTWFPSVLPLSRSFWICLYWFSHCHSWSHFPFIYDDLIFHFPQIDNDLSQIPRTVHDSVSAGDVVRVVPMVSTTHLRKLCAH